MPVPATYFKISNAETYIQINNRKRNVVKIDKANNEWKNKKQYNICTDLQQFGKILEQ